MTNMNESEIKRIEGFFTDDNQLEGSIVRMGMNRQRSSPNQLSLNLTITSRDGQKRFEKKKQQQLTNELNDNRHGRVNRQRGIARVNPLEIAASELQKFNLCINNLERKSSDIMSTLDRAERCWGDKEQQSLRNQAYNDMQLLSHYSKNYHRELNNGKQQLVSQAPRSTQLHIDKLKQEIVNLSSHIHDKQSEIQRHKCIIDTMSYEISQKESVITVLENRIGQQDIAIRQLEQKTLVKDVQSTVNTMLVEVEKCLQIQPLNHQIKSLMNKIECMCMEIERANLQKSTLFRQTKNLEDKLLKYTQTMNNVKLVSGTKNTSIGDLSMRQFSFSADPTDHDINQWINVFTHYRDHNGTKTIDWCSDFQTRENKKPTTEDKKNSSVAECFGFKKHFGTIVFELKMIKAIKEKYVRVDEPQKSPLKEINMNRSNPHNNSGILNSLNNVQCRPRETKELEYELEILKKSLESVKKERNRLENQNQNLKQSNKELQIQLMRAINDTRDDSVIADESPTAIKMAEYQKKIQHLDEQLKQYLAQKIKLKGLMKKNSQLMERIRELELDVKNMQHHLETEFILRRKLHNEVEDMKGNIRVFCRIRPLIQNELERHCQSVIGSNHDEVIVMAPDRTKNYKYDAVFAQESSQEEVFDDTKKMVQSAFDGYNVCIFAYGQTGSGKTYTMHGTDSSPGLARRSIDQLYRLIDKSPKHHTVTVDMQMVEVYLDNVYDLFDKVRRPLEICEDPETKQVCVKSCYRVKVKSAQDMYTAYRDGLDNRKTSSTQMNAESSRSHLLFIVRIQVEFKEGKQAKKKRRGTFNLIDLAGSEKLNRAGLRDNQIRECTSINSSLTALGRVLTALSEKIQHIPYRESKLTHLLKDSLGGNSKTLMFVNVSPADYNIQQSCISLHFANQVKKVQKSQAQINMVKERLNSQQDEKTRRPASKIERPRSPFE